MATMVFFHAHPDDEAIATGGTMALAAARGHRVVLVTATRGEVGEVDDGFLNPAETLGQRRADEAAASASILGVARLVFLDYRDSGMMGEATNDDPRSFWRADIEEAVARLRAVLDAEEADVLTIYDSHGGYGHPDHIQVHRVGSRAAEMAGTTRVYQATMNRERMKARRRTQILSEEGDRADVEAFYDTLGTPEAEITTAIDVREMLAVKRAAMTAHASQIGPDSWFLTLSPAEFETSFGTEWYIRVRPPFDGSVPNDRDTFLV